MPLPALIADGGELTVVRRLAFFVYGYWDVDWPDDFEPPKLEEGLRLGYVGRLNESDPGLSARRFIREDVSITATNDHAEPPELGASNVEEIFDTAVSKASGEVFFEKDITNAGLGRLRPLTDFFVGDRVPVFLWGRILTGQLITAIDCIGTATEPVGYRVHVGGQVLGDAVARARQKKDMQRDIVAERRARLRDVGGVSSVASAAKDAAKVADRKAEDADAKAETADSKAEDALEKWRQQKDELDAFQSQQIEKNRELASETSRLAKAIDRRATGMIFLERDKTVYSTTHGMGMYMPRTNRWALVVATPPFTGTAVVDYYYSGGSVVPFSMGKADFELVEYWKSWSYRDSYYGARFDPLMDAQGRMLIKWIKVEIGDVRAAKLTVDKIDWS